MMPAAALLILLAGVAIGATGIGGILVVPVLTDLGGKTVLAAVAASSAAFALTGALALWRERRAADKVPRGVYLAALAGAAAGALLAQWLPGSVLRIAVAALAIASGAHAWLTLRRARAERPMPRPAVLSSIGLLVGCGSALSGTGGPVLMLPLLLLLGAPLRGAIVVAQSVQLPVALAAGSVHAAAGRLDIRLAAGLGVLLAAGSWLGYLLADKLPNAGLKRAVAALLIATGIGYGWNSV